MLNHKHVNRKHRMLRHTFRKDKAFQFSGKLNNCLIKSHKHKFQESQSHVTEETNRDSRWINRKKYSGFVEEEFCNLDATFPVGEVATNKCQLCCLNRVLTYLGHQTKHANEPKRVVLAPILRSLPAIISFMCQLEWL